MARRSHFCGTLQCEISLTISNSTSEHANITTVNNGHRENVLTGLSPLRERSWSVIETDGAESPLKGVLDLVSALTERMRALDAAIHAEGGTTERQKGTLRPAAGAR